MRYVNFFWGGMYEDMILNGVLVVISTPTESKSWFRRSAPPPAVVVDE